MDDRLHRQLAEVEAAGKAHAKLARTKELAEVHNQMKTLDGTSSSMAAAHDIVAKELEDERAARLHVETALVVQALECCDISSSAWAAMSALRHSLGHLGMKVEARPCEDVHASLDGIHNVAPTLDRFAKLYGDHCAQTAWHTALGALKRKGWTSCYLPTTKKTLSRCQKWLKGHHMPSCQSYRS